jgi:hypothetical protein
MSPQDCCDGLSDSVWSLADQSSQLSFCANRTVRDTDDHSPSRDLTGAGASIIFLGAPEDEPESATRDFCGALKTYVVVISRFHTPCSYHCNELIASEQQR